MICNRFDTISELTGDNFNVKCELEFIIDANYRKQSGISVPVMEYLKWFPDTMKRMLGLIPR